jgi:metallo-beta-lactamase class B
MRAAAVFVAVLALISVSTTALAQQSGPAAPKRAEAGTVWTQEGMFRRNVGSREDQMTPFTPHKVIGNIYYVGTRSLASFLIATPDGHILINTNYEAGVPGLKDSVETLGFRFGDIKIVLGSHAHGDHMEGDALVKEMTGAQVMAMAEDVPALERMRPGGKPHPVDRILRDGDRVILGGATLVARLTPGHTRGCTTWTTTVQEDGRARSVVIVGSMGSNPGFQFVNNKDNPTIADEYKQGFRVLRSLKPDVPLASHPAMYDMAGKFARIGKGPNPFIDPAGYTAELDAVEGLFLQVLAAQQKAAAEANR